MIAAVQNNEVAIVQPYEYRNGCDESRRETLGIKVRARRYGLATSGTAIHVAGRQYFGIEPTHHVAIGLEAIRRCATRCKGYTIYDTHIDDQNHNRYDELERVGREHSKELAAIIELRNEDNTN